MPDVWDDTLAICMEPDRSPETETRGGGCYVCGGPLKDGILNVTLALTVHVDGKFDFFRIQFSPADLWSGGPLGHRAGQRDAPPHVDVSVRLTHRQRRWS